MALKQKVPTQKPKITAQKAKKKFRWQPIHATLMLALMVHTIALFAYYTLSPKTRPERLRVIAQVDLVDNIAKPPPLPKRIEKPPPPPPPKKFADPKPAAATKGRIKDKPPDNKPPPKALKLKVPKTKYKKADRSTMMQAKSSEGDLKGKPDGDPDGVLGGEGTGGGGTGGDGTGGYGGGGADPSAAKGPSLFTKGHEWQYTPEAGGPQILNTGEANLPDSEFAGLGEALVEITGTVAAGSNRLSAISVASVQLLTEETMADDQRSKRMAGLGYLLAQTANWSVPEKDWAVRFTIKIHGLPSESN